MSRPKLLATHWLFPEARKILEATGDVDYWKESDAIPREEFLRRIVGKDGLVCLLTEKVNEELLASAPALRIAATVSVGYDNLDVPACTKHHVVATNTPGVLDDTTADFAFALMLAVARRLVEADKWLRAGNWTGWKLDQFCSTDVWGKTLGIIGFGRIGREVARRAQGFKMRVIYSNRKRVSPELEKEFNAEYVSLDRLFAESDFITLHVPLTPATRHLINADTLRKMKRTAFLINTSRGPVVDEAALAAAVKAGTIAGAGLDVYEREPVVNPDLIPLPNVVLAPHLGSSSLETRTKMAVLAATNVAAYFEGRQPPNALNPEALTR
ncbi:MAG TPA: D-glycerate dehydrogenase [Candidatus Acidoferrales bacterium]|nr:D-glycerate dehydrogenase [Candidatus Acidoferrales bacterium]